MRTPLKPLKSMTITLLLVLGLSAMAGCGDDPKPRDSNNVSNNGNNVTNNGNNVTNNGNNVTNNGNNVTNNGNNVTNNGSNNATNNGTNNATNNGTNNATNNGTNNATNNGTGEHFVPPTEVCEVLTPLASGVCETSGTGANVLIKGIVLTPEKVFEGGQVLYNGSGEITCVGCNCAADAAAANAVTVTCPQGVVSPGLINGHDHVGWTHQAPARWGDERYEHRHDWRRGLRGHTEINSSGGASAEQKMWGELRQAMVGTTSLSGAGSAAGFIRNLDRSQDNEALGQPQVELSTFPLGDTGGQLRSSGCSYPDLPPASVSNYDSWSPHISEGIDAEARNEFLCLASQSNGGIDVVGGNTALIHGIALLPPEGSYLAQVAAALVWSPRSNVSLYGNTASVTMLHRQGVLIGLGTDWTPSGSVQMARELACADALNQNNYDNYFTDYDLWLMATLNNAIAFSVEDAIGALAPGLDADIAIYDLKNAATPWRSIIEATAGTTALVLRGGKPIFGDSALVSAIPLGDMTCDTIPGGACDVAKTACMQRTSGADLRFSELMAANTNAYDLFFCGVPAGEPSCVPFRNTEYDGLSIDGDADGDGIGDNDDNCPRIFNPIRPVDGELQADFDGDGEGDVCDPCPMNADTTTCTVPNIYDPDGDEVIGAADNCPVVANADQLDTDNDGKGDACDACPMESNPGSAGCTVTIYALKQGTVPSDTNVGFEGVVTAVGGNRFFVQVPEAEHDVTLGYTYSGVFVYVPSGNPSMLTIPVPGNRVRVDGVIADYFGELQVSNVSAVQVLEASVTIPTPVERTPAELARTGATAEPYEGVLVHVSGAVTAVNPTAGPGEMDPTNAYILADSAQIDDYLYATEPFPQIGDELDVTGVLRFANDVYKVEPRDFDDVLFLNAAEAGLEAFAPGTAFIEVGATAAATVPELALLLDRPVVGDQLIIPVTSSDENVLTVVDGGVTILHRAQSGAILVNALAVGTATLTASLDGTMVTATVQVIDPARTPGVATVAPETVTVSVGTRAQVTVTLDAPAPAGGVTVTLADEADGNVTLPETTVVIPAWELSGTFDIEGAAVGTDTVTATANGVSAAVTVEVSDRPMLGFIISEVLYDVPSTDDMLEWVELYNGTADTIDLSGYALSWGGTAYGADKLQLAGSIAPGQCFVVGGPTSSAVNFSPVFDQSVDFNSDIQNADGARTADGIALFASPASGVTNMSVPIDAVIYGGINDSELIDSTGSAPAPMVADTSSGSIERTASGWRVQAAPTPNDCNALFVTE